MFIDEVNITVQGGKGGDGCVSFCREKYRPKGGPDGGNGGAGGSVFLRADPDTQSLESLRYQPHYQADRGQHGRGKDQHGANGHDVIIAVPVGTTVYDRETENNIADLTEAGQQVCIAVGGRGGYGNRHFVSSTHQAPREHEPGEDGETRRLHLELKSIADIGLVGYPNAGKSTLLNAVSHAHPKTAPYPFTTLHACVGIVQFGDYSRLSIADIPGLIEGAHNNVGLGHGFLRHVERASVLVYVVDAAGSDGRSPLDDLHSLQHELECYQTGLSQRSSLLVANKMDLPEAHVNIEEIRANIDMPIFPICALQQDSLKELLTTLRRMVQTPQPA